MSEELERRISQLITKMYNDLQEDLDAIRSKVDSLEYVINALCATNFLIEPDAVNEEYRGMSIQEVNRMAKRASNAFTGTTQE